MDGSSRVSTSLLAEVLVRQLPRVRAAGLARGTAHGRLRHGLEGKGYTGNHSDAREPKIPPLWSKEYFIWLYLKKVSYRGI